MSHLRDIAALRDPRCPMRLYTFGGAYGTWGEWLLDIDVSQDGFIGFVCQGTHRITRRFPVERDDWYCELLEQLFPQNKKRPPAIVPA